jgi:hypothetical protein
MVNFKSTKTVNPVQRKSAMSIAPETEVSFLLELYKSTEGDPSIQKSMFDTGAAIGLAKEQAGKVAEEIIGRGWAEVRTLSGGIGITSEGIEAALQHGGSPLKANVVTIGNAPILDGQSRQSVEQILTEIKLAIGAITSDFDRIEELVLDIKTIDVQMLSPRPKTAVIKSVLSAMHSTLSKAGAKELGERIKCMIE